MLSMHAALRSRFVRPTSIRGSAVMLYTCANAFAQESVPTMKGSLFSGKQFGSFPSGGLHSPYRALIPLHAMQQSLGCLTLFHAYAVLFSGPCALFHLFGCTRGAHTRRFCQSQLRHVPQFNAYGIVCTRRRSRGYIIYCCRQ